MSRAKLLFVIIFGFSASLSFGQTETDKDLFLKKLKQEIYPYLHADVYQEGKVFINYYRENNHPILDRKMRTFHQLMKENHLSVSEDYFHLFRIYNAYYQGKFDEDQLLDLINFSGKFLQNARVSEIKRLVVVLANFLEETTLFASQNYSWKIETDKWKFETEPTAIIHFPKANLICSNGDDEFKIRSTKGDYYLLNGDFVGQGGNTSWQGGQRKAEIGAYQFKINSIYFQSENATLFDRSISHKPIKGTLTHRMYFQNEENIALEPQFVSTEIIPIKRKSPNLKIESGIHVKGHLLDLIAPKGKSSKITFYQDGKAFVKLDAQKFTLESGRFFAREVMFKLFLLNDSITHPSIDLSFDINALKMEAKRSENKLGKTPFYDGLHELQIVANFLTWEDKNKELIFMNKAMSRLEPVYYQSLHFFDINWYIDLFDFGTKHPTSGLLQLTKRNKDRRSFYLEELFEVYKEMKEEELISLMEDFTNQGFVYYNPFERKIEVKNRFFRFVTALNTKSDYDQIRFRSNINNRPASIIDLASGDMTTFAVKEVQISRPKDVSLHPSDQQLLIYPKLDIEFDGLTTCGKFGFFGNNQLFRYEDYVVDFEKIDSFRYLLESRMHPEDTSILIRPCQTSIQEVTGLLKIDKPKNKSAKKEHQEYPIFESKENSYVFYDRVRDGLYPKEDFHFEVFPFKIDSLMTKNTFNLSFGGTLVSGGIFPNIEERLSLFPNDQLGFERKMTQDYALFEKGNYRSYLRLNNDGLNGKGTINYQDIYLEADSLDFYPSYLFADVQKMTNNSTQSFSPNLRGKNLRLDWFKSDEILEFKTQDQPISVNHTSTLEGGIEISPYDYIAYGKWQDRNIFLRSDSILLTRENMQANKAFFKVFDENTQNFLEHEIVLTAPSSQVEYQYGNDMFQNNDIEKSSKYTSPFLRYRFVYPMFTYERANSEIFFEENTEDSTKQTTIVESLNPFTGQIKYLSPTAHINMKTHKVSMYDIQGIQVADAQIRPKEEKLTLLASGLPEKLYGADLDLINPAGDIRYSFENADINIIHADDYIASADFIYTNRLGETQKARFDSLQVSENKISYGSTEVSSNFKIDPQMSYTGTLDLKESSKKMELDGHLSFDDPCLGNSSELFSYQDTLNNENIQFGSVESKDSILPEARFVFNTFSHQFYVQYASNQLSSNEVSLVNIPGTFQFDDQQGYYTYQGSDENDLAKFDSERCIYELESFLNLSHTKSLKSYGYGRFFHEENKADSLIFQAHLGLDLPLPKKALKEFYKDFRKQTRDYETTYESSELFVDFLRKIIGEKGERKYYKAKSRNKKYVPKPMQSTIFFTDLELQWNAKRQRFENTLPLEVNHIRGKKIDRIVEGFLVYKPEQIHDMWKIYLEFEENQFYYFELRDGILYTSSSNDRYNKIINQNKKAIKKKGYHYKVIFHNPSDELH
ncbi:MAG: hypothetical protein N4A45_12355 [Flavobacteriales bacterium]|jgi:hypothetical protein|nr:hypothetical protein [Flavobacteriales bacterium]